MRPSILWISLLSLLLTAACATDDDVTTPSDPTPPVMTPPPALTLEPPTAEEGFQLSMTTTVGPGEEAWICEVYRMPIEDWSAVNWVEYMQTPGMHHMTLSTHSLSGKNVPYGTYDCEVLYQDLMEDLVMFFGGQGTAEGVMNLPEGIAANFPTGIDVVHEVHYVNIYQEPVEIYSHVNAYTIPQEDVVAGIWGGQVRDEHIEIPANSTHTEWTRCVMTEDVEMIFLASHTHKLGVEFTISHFDGTEVEAEPFYVNDDWHDPKPVQYDPPLVVPAGTGFEFSCTWTNPTDQPITYGSTADDEMCNMAIVHTPQSATAKCEVVDSSDGVLWSDD
jgi:hypothetical protein